MGAFFSSEFLRVESSAGCRSEQKEGNEANGPINLNTNSQLITNYKFGNSAVREIFCENYSVQCLLDGEPNKNK